MSIAAFKQRIADAHTVAELNNLLNGNWFALKCSLAEKESAIAYYCAKRDLLEADNEKP